MSVLDVAPFQIMVLLTGHELVNKNGSRVLAHHALKVNLEILRRVNL